MSGFTEWTQTLLDHAASGQWGARDLLIAMSAAGLSAGSSAETMQQALAASETQMRNQSKPKRAYDYIVIGSGASGAIVAGELSKTGGDVLVVESGGEDAGPTISNPSIWFYNVGGPLDWALPIVPVPQLNNRPFNMALGRVLGGGSSVNAMVWTRGTERDYDSWERQAPKAGASRTSCRYSKRRRIGKAAQTRGAVRTGLSTSAGRRTRIQRPLPSSKPPGRWAFPFWMT
jgi:choline dehydrogenase